MAIDFSDLGMAPATDKPVVPTTHKIDFSDLGMTQNSAESPGEANFFPNREGAEASFIPQGERDRMKSGFASDDIMSAALKNNGFTNAHKNKDGDWVAQDKHGNWVKDQNNFFPNTTGTPGAGPVQRLGEMVKSAHPLNWAESGLSSIPATVGMLGGGAAAVAAAPESLGTSLLAAPAAAGIGAGAGDVVKQKIGNTLGVNSDPDIDWKSAGKEGAKGAAAELGGKLVGKIPLSYPGMNDISKAPVVSGNVEGLLAKAGDAARSLITKPLSHLIAPFQGVAAGSAEQVMKDPIGVMGADALGTAGAADAALNAKNKILGKNVENAKNALGAATGEKTFDSSPSLDKAYSRIDNAVKEGWISDEDAKALKTQADSIYTTKHVDTQQVPWQRPAELGPDTPIYRGRHPELGKQPWTLDPNEAVTHAGPEGFVRQGKIGDVGKSIDPNELFPQGQNSATVKLPGLPHAEFPADGFPTTQTKSTEIEVPAASFDNLRKGLGQLSPGSTGGPGQAYFNKQGIVPQGSNKFLDQLAAMRSDVRDLLLSGKTPESKALGQANVTLHDFKNDSDLVRGIQLPAQQENFVKNLGNAGKKAQMGAAERQLPSDVLEKLRNVIAQTDYGASDGPSLMKAIHGTLGTAAAVPQAIVAAPSVPWNLLKSSKQVAPAAAWSLMGGSNEQK